MSERWMVALLGRPDEPTDAVEEYCGYLGSGLRGRGIALEIARVPWASMGWAVALREFRQRAESWRGTWVLVQYTALAWSTHGFPQKFLRIVEALRDAGARVCVVYHDVEPYGGKRVVDRLRRRAQLGTMRSALRSADAGVFTVPLSVVSWLGQPPDIAHFIPIGANLPIRPAGAESYAGRAGESPRVAIFGITGGETGKKECHEIIAALAATAKRIGKLKLHAFGRGAMEAENVLREGLRGAGVEVQMEDVLPAERVVDALREADLMLFVREPISSRRGSAIAGISCGLPVIAYGGPHTTAPISEAGVVLVSKARPEELGAAMIRVLSDPKYRELLAERSRSAYGRYFNWGAIAERYADVLK
jgi:glycosyltransferase involved in cell wall biosynthesis